MECSRGLIGKGASQSLIFWKDLFPPQILEMEFTPVYSASFFKTDSYTLSLFLNHFAPSFFSHNFSLSLIQHFTPGCLMWLRFSADAQMPLLWLKRCIQGKICNPSRARMWLGLLEKKISPAEDAGRVSSSIKHDWNWM